MTPTPPWRIPYPLAARPHPLRIIALPAVLALTLSLPAGSRAAETRSGTGSAPLAANDTTADVAATIAALGFDNVTADSGAGILVYENRRFLHSAFARGVIDRRLAEPDRSAPLHLYIERRWGAVVSAVERGSGDPPDESGGAPASVRYPSDRDFPRPPRGPSLGSTRWATDLEFAPRLTYVLGQISDPFQSRLEVDARLRTNPWPGARLTASLLIPIQNEFQPDSIASDIGRWRPGSITLEQFVWVPRVALLSGTAGVFLDNRYGLSFGAARPVAGGAFLLDAQADVTGYIAFPATGMTYSSIGHFTGFGGVTWRPPAVDCAFRVRAERFVDGDQGAELEVRRALGDLDVAFFYQRTGELNVSGVRLLIPVPPFTRRHATTHPPGLPLRILPVERVSLDYRDDASAVGRSLKGVASREDYLRHLSLPGLSANDYRYRAARGWGASSPPRGERPSVSLTGMTGFTNTPWCGVMGDRGIEAGYNLISKKAAYDHRGQFRNDVYYASLGFLPRVEAGFRWSFIPGLKTFVAAVPTSNVTDSDRMLSGRLEVLAPRVGRPGLALGIEDASGTRRFHSTYVVTGMPFEFQRMRMRASLGYAPRIIKRVARRTLDGGFGAVEANVWKTFAVSLEYDSEKWNAGLAVAAPLGLRLRGALLDGHPGFGAGLSIGL